MAISRALSQKVPDLVNIETREGLRSFVTELHRYLQETRMSRDELDRQVINSLTPLTFAPPIAAAATIEPVHPVQPITGTAAVANILAGKESNRFVLLAQDGFSVVTGGNIGAEVNVPSGASLELFLNFNDNLWYPTATDADLNLAQFGVVGDGSDETVGINAALVAGTGRTVRGAPNTTYIFSSSLYIPNATTLAGEGESTVFKIADGAYNATNFPHEHPPITNLDRATGHDIGLRDCVIDGNIAGNSTAGPPGVLVTFLGTLARFKISGVIFKNFPGATAGPPYGGACIGIGMTGYPLQSEISDGLIENNTFLNARGGALVIFGPRNRIINNRHIGGSDAGFGAQGTVARGNIFQGNIVKDLTEANMYSFYVDGASETSFIGNVMDNSNGLAIVDMSLAKPMRNLFIGNSFINSPANIPSVTFVQSGAGLGASDNMVIFNMGPNIPTDPYHIISGTLGKNLVILVDQADGYLGFLDTVANQIKWVGVDTLGRLAFMNNAKALVATISETGLIIGNAKPLYGFDAATVERAILNMTAADDLEIGGGMVAGIVILSKGGRDIKWNVPMVALGGGAVPTLGTIGGSGPTNAAQAGWERRVRSDGTIGWVPIWI